jgi:hypothetical protein
VNTHRELIALTLVRIDMEYAERWLYFAVEASSVNSFSFRHAGLMAIKSQ